MYIDFYPLFLFFYIRLDDYILLSKFYLQVVTVIHSTPLHKWLPTVFMVTGVDMLHSSLPF